MTSKDAHCMATASPNAVTVGQWQIEADSTSNQNGNRDAVVSVMVVLRLIRITPNTSVLGQEVDEKVVLDGLIQNLKKREGSR